MSTALTAVIGGTWPPGTILSEIDLLIYSSINGIGNYSSKNICCRCSSCRSYRSGGYHVYGGGKFCYGCGDELDTSINEAGTDF